MLFLVNHLRKQGFSINVIHVGKDGTLVKSVNFMKVFVKELNEAVQELGGYNSENNGIVESPIKPVKQMIWVLLNGAALPDIIWCYAFQYAIYIINHQYNRMIYNLPIMKWHDKIMSSTGSRSTFLAQKSTLSQLLNTKNDSSHGLKRIQDTTLD